MILIAIDPIEDVSLEEIETDNDDSCVEAVSTRRMICHKLNVAGPDDYRQTLLIRPSEENGAGLYAYHCFHFDISEPPPPHQPKQQPLPNIRATRLAMACGLYRLRLFGMVLLSRTSEAPHDSHNDHVHDNDERYSLRIPQLWAACTLSPDLRPSHFAELLAMEPAEKLNSLSHVSSSLSSTFSLPSWLGNAARNNYHDQDVINRLAQVMTTTTTTRQSTNPLDVDTVESDNNNSQSETDPTTTSSTDQVVDPVPPNQTTTVTDRPLCLSCRRPAARLCPGCRAAYFCDPPRTCLTDW